jgi:hypothetical protein
VMLFHLVKREWTTLVRWSLQLLKALIAFDNSTPKFVAFDERVRCYRRHLRQTNPGNPKEVIKENCAF